MAKKVVVVRVGEKTTHIVHMENSQNNPTILGCVRIATPEGVVEDGMVRDVVELGRRIKSACKDKSIHTTEAIFTIASSKIASRETTIPAVAKNKIAGLIQAKIPDLFPVDPDRYVFAHVLQGKEYTVDTEAVAEEENEADAPETDAKGKKKKQKKSAAKSKNLEKHQDVRVFAAPEELVRSYYTLANAAGFTVVAIEADGNAVFQAMSRQVKDGVVMAIQINRDSTLVNIIDSEKVYLQRVIPYGVSVFTDVMIGEEIFKTPDYESAYEVLTKQRVLLSSLNSENPTDNVALDKRIEVTENGDFLISNIYRVIEYYNSHYSGRPILKVLCTGQGCSVAGLSELLSNELGIPVEMPSTLEGVKFNRKIEIDSAILQYINCFGSVYNPVKFLPKEVAMREANKGGMATSAMIFVGVVIISAVLIGVSLLRLAVDSTNMKRVQVKYNALAPIQGEYNNLMQLETNYAVTESLNILMATNNNYFHSFVSELEDIVPTKFRIQSIQSDETQVTISATTADKLSSLSALQMQMKEVEGIENVTINEISTGTDSATGRKQYQYTLTYTYDNTERNEAIDNIQKSVVKDTTSIGSDDTSNDSSDAAGEEE